MHSVKLARSKAQAGEIPTGDIELLHCKHCSMIWNHQFRPELMHYDENYEETQAYSPTFQDFHHWLADWLVDDHDLQGKTVLEIGCGKGEFLALLADRGIAQGIGYDPGFDKKRLQHYSNLSFFPELFPPETDSPKAADFYLCKMTLEHIHQPLEFLRGLRRIIINPRTKLAIQVPAFERIAKECAYWDIYYEHCNYFSKTSLTILLENAGFEVVSLETVFDDQYLNAVAQPGQNRSDHTDNLESLIENFSSHIQASLQAWKRELVPAANAESLLIWGAASKAVALINAIPELRQGTTLIDINPHKHGTYLPSTELQIKAPDSLINQHFDLVLVANPIYLPEIKTELSRLNIRGRVIALTESPQTTDY